MQQGIRDTIKLYTKQLVPKSSEFGCVDARIQYLTCILSARSAVPIFFKITLSRGRSCLVTRSWPIYCIYFSVDEMQRTTASTSAPLRIQSIFIKELETRGGSKPYTVYKITVQAAVRTWNVWHRYSEFATLHQDLLNETSSPPPASLPSKHNFSIRSPFGRGHDEKVLEERRTGLETYLRAILSSKDSKWRDTLQFRDFIGAPTTKIESSFSTSGSHFTSSSWLDEHAELQTLVRDIRADLNKRDALSVRNEVAASHTSNVQGKKKLATLISRLDVLSKGIDEIALGGLAEGEVQRRKDMAARLQDDATSLGKMVIAARRIGALSGAGVVHESPASQGDRDVLLSMPGSLGEPSSTRQVGRVFGKRTVQETDQTRPLDDAGLMQLQQVQMEQQDAQIGQLFAAVHRQKHLGLAVHDEVAYQNELLDQLSADIDNTGVRLASAKKQIGRLG